MSDSEQDPDLLLIEMVRGKEVLWNTSRWDYKNNDKKDKVWCEIARQLTVLLDQDFTGIVCKKRFANLKLQYFRAEKKLPSGSGTDDMTPKMKELSFLKDAQKERKTHSNVPSFSAKAVEWKAKNKGKKKKSSSTALETEKSDSSTYSSACSSPEPPKKLPKPNAEGAAYWSTLNELGIPAKEIDDADKRMNASSSPVEVDAFSSKREVFGEVDINKKTTPTSKKTNLFKKQPASATKVKQETHSEVLKGAVDVFKSCAMKLNEKNNVAPSKTEVQAFADHVGSSIVQLLNNKPKIKQAKLQLKIQSFITELVIEEEEEDNENQC